MCGKVLLIRFSLASRSPQKWIGGLVMGNTCCLMIYQPISAACQLSGIYTIKLFTRHRDKSSVGAGVCWVVGKLLA